MRVKRTEWGEVPRTTSKVPRTTSEVPRTTSEVPRTTSEVPRTMGWGRDDRSSQSSPRRPTLGNTGRPVTGALRE